jgi:ABC-type sugar transport system ATPase subunit
VDQEGEGMSTSTDTTTDFPTETGIEGEVPPSRPPREQRTPIMQATGLVKRYGRVTAIDGCDFELYPGEILGVIGDNGAGKSSLIKALSGALVPDEGEIRLDGQVVHFKNPMEARHAGIETVYQTLAVAPGLDIADNLFLGREERKPARSVHCFGCSIASTCGRRPSGT